MAYTARRYCQPTSSTLIATSLRREHHTVAYFTSSANLRRIGCAGIPSLKWLNSVFISTAQCAKPPQHSLRCHLLATDSAGLSTCLVSGPGFGGSESLSVLHSANTTISIGSLTNRLCKCTPRRIARHSSLQDCVSCTNRGSPSSHRLCALLPLRKQATSIKVGWMQSMSRYYLDFKILPQMMTGAYTVCLISYRTRKC